MTQRKFNQSAYDKYDKPANKKVIEIMNKYTDYKLLFDEEVELYKLGDVVFTKGDKFITFENENRDAFDDIVKKYNTIHIPLRKRDTPVHFYIVWRNDYGQFILIKRDVLLKYRNNIAKNILCKHEKNQDGPYIEDFVDIPKEETQWYIIGPNLKLQKVNY